MTDFQQKIILVTGASTGVGEGIARELLKRGAKVAITGRNPEHLQKAINEWDPTGNSVLAIEADVRKLSDCKRMVSMVLDKFGALHGLVNNAGITGPHGVKIEDYDFEAWQDVMATDVTGTFLGMKFGIPAIIKSGGGAVVNLSACNGVTGIAGIAPYTAAKHAVLGLTRAAALEYAEQGVRINAVGPGYVATPNILALPQDVQAMMAESHPMKRMATREEVAKMVAFLLSDDSRFCTGGFYPVDGGYTAQ